MRHGVPLDDADRAPWLAAVGAWIDGWRRVGVSGVITCSALKRAYRRTLIRGRAGLLFVFLKGPASLLAARLEGRHGHFMPPGLLASQFAALEEPGPEEGAIVVDVGRPVEAQVLTVVAALPDVG